MSPVDLQIVFAAVGLAALQSTIVHFPRLCFLYHHIKIFPTMSSLLQVGERLSSPSACFPAKYCSNHSIAVSVLQLHCWWVFLFFFFGM